MLSEYKVNPNFTDAFGKTPLMLAVMGENRSMVLTLLQFGADKEILNPKGKTALMIAREKKNQRIIAHLESSLSSLETVEDKKIKNQIFKAIKRNDSSLVMGLLNEEKNQAIKAAALINVVQNSRYLLVKDMLAIQKADPNVTDINGMTPLMHAAVNESGNIITLLLMFGAKKDAINADGKTALMLARERGNQQICGMLRF